MKGAVVVVTALLVSLGAVTGLGAACSPDGRVKITVKLAPPTGRELAGVKVVVDYPEASVGIPGFQNWPEVKARVSDLPPNFLSAPNDTDTELIVGIAGTAVLPTGIIFTVDFDHCTGSPDVSAADFRCQVPEASTPQGALVDGSTCTVEITSEDQKTNSKRGISK